jgi:hypothetical protein
MPPWRVVSVDSEVVRPRRHQTVNQKESGMTKAQDTIAETGREQRKEDVFNQKLKHAGRSGETGLSCNEASVDELLSAGEST